jgi:L-threonylcarbamoyladenylate synthase
VKPLPFQSDSEIATAIPLVVEHLRNEGLLAYPTETVYGLGSRALHDDVAKLAALKGRTAGKPFLLLISNREMAEAHGLAFNASADALAKAFWPGPLTLVLPGGSGRLPDLLRGPDGGIAVRWTSHQAIAQLVQALSVPLTSTSANLPGRPPGPGAAAIARDFAAAVDSDQLLVLDGGVLGNRPPSTVVDCTRPEAQIVREGTLSVAELRRAVGSRLAP